MRATVTRFFDGSATGWDERTGAPSAEHLAPLAAAATHVKPAPERVLDVGTGTGVGALMLAREFPQARVRGVDVSARMIREATGKVGLDPEGRVAFRIADAAALPYDDDSFDLVTHLNMPPFFAEVTRVLRPGGHVIVAASHGPATPFYTPGSVLARRFARFGVEEVETGTVAAGTYFLGRLPG
jgi:malonyl-CoA O-methyltransferase